MARNRADHFGCGGELDGDFCAYHAHALRKRLQRMGFGAADVDDLVQHTFVIAQQGWGEKPRGRGRERSWLEGIAWRLAMNLRRRRIRRRESLCGGGFDRFPSCSVDIEGCLDAQRIVSLAATEWQPNDKEMLFEYYIDGDSVAMIAARHGLARSTAWSRLQKLRRQIMGAVRLLDA